MTSRDVPRRRAEDPLDAMIRWVLRDRVSDVAPPPGVWERISERLIQQTAVNDVAWGEGFRPAVEAMGLWLLAASAVGVQIELPHHGFGASSPWSANPLCLADQYGVLLRRLAVL